MNHFTKAIHLLENGRNETYPAFAYSVLENIISGQVYMNTSSQSALIGTDSGVFAVAGEQTNIDIQHLILDMFEIREKENKRFTLFSPSKEWDQTIQDLLGNRIRRINRLSYQFSRINFTARMNGELSAQNEVQKIDETVIANSTEYNEAYINEYWGSVSNFMNNGFGYCLIHDNVIASECISIFSSSQYAELDIATESKYRGRGFARKVAEAFIEHCMEKNKTPRWDCVIHNTASITFAESLGFEHPTEYSVYIRN